MAWVACPAQGSVLLFQIAPVAREAFASAVDARTPDSVGVQDLVDVLVATSFERSCDRCASCDQYGDDGWFHFVLRRCLFMTRST